MYRLVASIVVAAPRDEVFAAYCDPEIWQAVLPGLVGLSMLNDPPFGLGTRWRQRRRLLWMSDESEAEVTVFEPPERLEYRIEHPKLAAEGAVFHMAEHFADEDGATRWSVGVSLEMPKPVPGPILWMMRAPLGWGARRDLRAFKRFLERRRRAAR